MGTGHGPYPSTDEYEFFLPAYGRVGTQAGTSSERVVSFFLLLRGPEPGRGRVRVPDEFERTTGASNGWVRFRGGHGFLPAYKTVFGDVYRISGGVSTRVISGLLRLPVGDDTKVSW